MNASWQFGPETEESSDQELDFQVVEPFAYRDSQDDFGVADDSLLRELFPRGLATRDGLAPISKSLSFEQGFVLAVKAIQELRQAKLKRARKERKVIVGIGGPGGSGKSSLAHKIACVVGCAVVSLENYLDASKAEDDENLETFESLDGALLKANLEDILQDRDTETPLFDFQIRERIGFRTLKSSDCSVVIVEGTFALHEEFSQYLDMRLSVVGGVHHNVVKRVHRDLKNAPSRDPGTTFDENSVLQSIFSSYKEHVEPHLKDAHIRIKNDFDYLASLREPQYILKARGEPDVGAVQVLLSSHDFKHTTETSVDTHIRVPGNNRLKDWLRIRQCGGFYSITFCERLVEGDFIISPRIIFATGGKTLESLLSLGYDVGIIVKRSSDIFKNNEGVAVCIDRVEELQETYISIKGTNRQAVIATAQTMGIRKSFVTQSNLELCLANRDSPEKKTQQSPPKSQASLPMRLMQAAACAVTAKTTQVNADLEKIDRSISPPLYNSGAHVELVPITKELPFDQGLLLAVRGVQKLREHRAHTNSRRLVIVGIGGPSGSGKSRLAQKMAELLNCETLNMEDYCIPSKIYVDNFDEFESHDTKLLCSHLESLRQGETVSMPQFDLTQKKRVGYRSFCPTSGVVIVEGVYALHKNVRPFLDFRIGVVGGVHFNLVKRVHREADRAGRSYSQNEILDTIFPLFREHIEPGLRHSHLRIRNHFDPLTSLQTPKYVLKSESAPPESEMKRLEEKLKLKFEATRKDNHTDIYLVFGGRNDEGKGKYEIEDGIRIRQCGGRYTVLFRDSLREGGFIIQPTLDFEVGVKTLAGLICLGYKMVALVEASVVHYKSETLHLTLEDIPLLRGKTYTIIRGGSKQVVQHAAEELGISQTKTTTKTFMELIREENSSSMSSFGHGTRSNSATEFNELIQRVAEQSPESFTAALASRHEYEITEIKSELQRLNRLLTLTAYFAGGILFPLMGMVFGSYFIWWSNSGSSFKRIR
ncbi:uridine kinase [Chloropicon primus]|uniref:Uridine kinase n=1 Tax=Chloropicon primus TaxID=1764295 RepID=A0A5B8MCL9_9CHLO|nr:uridine kinase [Chloropicon primus]UPQ97096.1 uridine kinase [Chloropicon primus]|eukprot:QDZ17881.1 uridine kinase [Chloropicon primus]